MKAVGDFDFSQTLSVEAPKISDEIHMENDMTEFGKNTPPATDSPTEESRNGQDIPSPHLDISTYKPNVKGREWIISETDLSWISTGCYILGTGGGGSPYGHMLRLREIMKNGGVVRVISPDDLKDEDLIACGGGKGSPTVSIEKLPGDEYLLTPETPCA